MKGRDYGLYLEDILEAIRRIENYTTSLTYEKFAKDNKTVDAVMRNLEIIGEATKQIPDDVRAKHPKIPWKDMAGMRDRLIHKYFGVALDVVWKTINVRLPEIKPLIEGALASMTKGSK
jgi:uncharacterized protein with HEPN domain